MNVLHRTPLALAVSLALCALADPARADDAPPKKNNDLEPGIETVIVTATKRSEQAYKLPINISAISEEQLREQNITDIKKLVAQSPAINAPQSGARFEDNVVVRGLSGSGTAIANDFEKFIRGTLAYYLDDTPLLSMGYRIKDVTRVETLLGPQGTLYGAGSLGGTVRYITNKPRLGQNQFDLNSTLYHTEHGGLSHDIDVVANQPLGSHFALRASLANLQEAGSTDRVSNPPWRTGADAWRTLPNAQQNVYPDDDWQHVKGARVAVLWQLRDGVSLTLAHTQQDQHASGTTGATLLPDEVANARTPDALANAWKNQVTPCGESGKPDCQYTKLTAPYAINDHTILSRYPDDLQRRFRLDTLDADAELNFAGVHVNVSHFDDRKTGMADYADKGAAYYFGLGDNFGGGITSGNSAYMTYDNRYQGDTGELRLVSKNDGRWNWIAGLYHASTTRSNGFSEWLPRTSSLPGGNGVAWARTDGRPDEGYRENLSSHYQETAVYGELGARLGERWHATLGARRFNYSDDAHTDITDFAGDYVSNHYDVHDSQSGRAYYKGNLAYDISERLLAYATVSQGFRRGGANGFREANASGSKVLTSESRAYAPDSTTNYELGLKGYLFDRRLYLEADIYRIDWHNTQVGKTQSVNGFPVNGIMNGPDVRAEGLDLSTRVRLNNAWQWMLSAAYVSGHFQSDKKLCLYADGSSCDTVSVHPPHLERHTT